MNAWLYKELNYHAKAWWAYKGNREKQRRSIRESLKTIRAALATKDAYVVIGQGDTSLHYQPQSDVCTYGPSTLSGFGCRAARMYQRLGLPVINMQEADFGALCKVVVSGPMVAVGTQEPDKPRDDGTYGSLDYCPLAAKIPAYRAAGCALFNVGD